MWPVKGTSLKIRTECPTEYVAGTRILGRSDPKADDSQSYECSLLYHDLSPLTDGAKHGDNFYVNVTSFLDGAVVKHYGRLSSCSEKSG